MNLLTALTVCSGSSFLVYGGLCVSSPPMKSEFRHFGLGRLKTLIRTLVSLFAGPNTPKHSETEKRNEMNAALRIR